MSKIKLVWISLDYSFACFMFDLYGHKCMTEGTWSECELCSAADNLREAGNNKFVLNIER